ncbi:MAG: glycosyltransferase [Burkholderiaceae bacterium]|nr:glycosyltransferase [Burkholderiaceae bacterium]
MGKTTDNARGASRPPLWLVGVGLILLSVVLLWPNLHSGTEQVRLRNALQLGPDWSEADDWKPPQRPAGFLVETVRADVRLAQVVERLNLTEMPDDWTRAQAIGRHLLMGPPSAAGGGIQADLWETHERIVRRGEGYCGDFVRVFIALANTAGLEVRPWAFSFDGFGGHGHIWVELWDRQQQRWQLIDVFNNYYFARGSSGDPLAALELRRALLASPGLGEVHHVALKRLVPEARVGYEIESKAWEYYQRGVDQWYLPFGNNVISIDALPAVKVFSGWSRVGEGIGTLVLGHAPSIRILSTERNAGMRTELRAVRMRVTAAAVSGALGALVLFLAPWLTPRRIRRGVVEDDGEGMGVARLRSTTRSTRGARAWPSVCVVGPLPPPSGGMANQCEQLVRLLGAEGVAVELVRNNAPPRPAWVGRLRFVRAAFSLVPYMLRLWRCVGRADVVHVFANSGWAWHLLAAPALWVARQRCVPAIVNYRGGLADPFLRTAPGHVHRALRRSALRVVPSGFLREVFARHGLDAVVIPNIIDLTRFRPQPPRDFCSAPHLVVTRNLEAIYDIPTALRAFAEVRRHFPAATLTVAGSGPERAALERLSADLGIATSVRFAGRIENARIGLLYAGADLMLNPSTADNMPISILEALASGVPVVSTDAGGIPHLVQHERSALLVRPGDASAMAAAALRVLGNPALAARLRQQGERDVTRYGWPAVRDQWQSVYERVARSFPGRIRAGGMKSRA